MAGARDFKPPPPFFSSPSPFKHQIQESAAAKAYDAEWKWMNSSEAKQRGAAAKALALSDFQKRFPHAQMSRFQVQVEFDANRKALGRVLFPDGNGSWEMVGVYPRKTTLQLGALTGGTPVAPCGCRPATPSAYRSTRSDRACAARTCTSSRLAFGSPG